ncbi:hypothetical protein SAMN05660690_0078 [Geodermatophilus telluris]|uniref:Uncharacterized protein n=1 Tax=Geodermatophilus telluris TaxID=1190417 RepID=A0A1G6HXN9_9ACTN|nr:hypothetical protein [Geodermatophilus telluris]SDB98913.1 hypothetical protein SAMN05660690_0078 [Geodermatophilus telluris]
MAGPRSGPAGTWDRIAGPDAGTGENAGSLGLGLAGALLAPGLARGHGRRAAPVLRLLALDLWGGAWCNNTPSAARWYHRPGQGARQHLAFAAGHVHPAVLAWVDAGGPGDRRARLRWAAALYAYLLAATALLTATRARRTRRVLGLATTAGGVLLDRALTPSAAAPWFAPVFFAKLLAGHAAGAALLPADPLAAD